MLDKFYFQKTLRALREAKGLTQKELAAKLFLTPQTVSKWEKGLSLPDLVLLGEICEVLGCSPASLLREKEEKECLYAALDSGGSKTEILLFNAAGKIAARKTVGAGNPNTVGFEKSAQTLIEGLSSLPQSPAAIYAGVAGCSSPTASSFLEKAIKKAFPSVPVWIESDIMPVFFNAAQPFPLLAGILGTGSAVFGYNGNSLTRHGGWGGVLGDPLSGFSLGRAALRERLAAEEGRIPCGILANKVGEAFGKNALPNLDLLYAGGNGRIASFAPLVFEAAKEGDATARSILQSEAAEFAEAVRFAAKEIGAKTLVLSGGLTCHEKELTLLLKPLLPQIELYFLKNPPIFGACRRAMNLLGLSDELPQLQNSYKECFK